MPTIEERVTDLERHAWQWKTLAISIGLGAAIAFGVGWQQIPHAAAKQAEKIAKEYLESDEGMRLRESVLGSRKDAEDAAAATRLAKAEAESILDTLRSGGMFVMGVSKTGSGAGRQPREVQFPAGTTAKDWRIFIAPAAMRGNDGIDGNNKDAPIERFDVTAEQHYPNLDPDATSFQLNSHAGLSPAGHDFRFHYLLIRRELVHDPASPQDEMLTAE